MDADTLIRNLRKPEAWPEPVQAIDLCETHAAWVLMSDTTAYKIKKPVDFGFLDYSSLEKRRFYCEEELRLNQRLAPGIYRDVVPITGTPQAPVFGGSGTALEYAVRMRRFAAGGLLSELAARDELTSTIIDALAVLVADFHTCAASAPTDSHYGTAAQVHHWVRENFSHIVDARPALESDTRLQHLRRWSEQEYERLAAHFEQRRAAGAIRECHGDLHLGNITLDAGRVTPFDCIEFNPELR